MPTLNLDIFSFSFSCSDDWETGRGRSNRANDCPEEEDETAWAPPCCRKDDWRSQDPAHHGQGRLKLVTVQGLGTALWSHSQEMNSEGTKFGLMIAWRGTNLSSLVAIYLVFSCVHLLVTPLHFLELFLDKDLARFRLCCLVSYRIRVRQVLLFPATGVLTEQEGACDWVKLLKRSDQSRKPWIEMSMCPDLTDSSAV